jgi:hypothetical protein
MSSPPVLPSELSPALAALRQKIDTHGVYAAVRSPAALALFTSHHVFAVWDFMSLLKRLQRDLTCVTVPWLPSAYPTAARLINEIVLGEESDETPDGYRSHYELYRGAMAEIGAPTEWIDRFINGLRKGEAVLPALRACGAPPSVVQFVETTFSIVLHGAIHEVAAVFTLTREDLVPEMFVRVTEECAMHRQDYPQFFYYLDRHIEVDSGSHGPMARALLQELCGNDAKRWQEAEAAACRALASRVALWDGVVEALSGRAAAV